MAKRKPAKVPTAINANPTVVVLTSQVFEAMCSLIGQVTTYAQAQPLMDTVRAELSRQPELYLQVPFEEESQEDDED